MLTRTLGSFRPFGLAAAATLMVAGCSRKQVNTYQGHIEGKLVYVASPQGGRLDREAPCPVLTMASKPRRQNWFRSISSVKVDKLVTLSAADQPTRRRPPGWNHDAQRHKGKKNTLCNRLPGELAARLRLCNSHCPLFQGDARHAECHRAIPGGDGGRD